MHQNIISNLPSFENLLFLSLPDLARPRILLKNLMNKLIAENPEKIIVLGIRFIGHRIVKLEDTSLEKFTKLLSGRRHRIYYAIAFKGRIYIDFAWHKLKYFSKQEHEFVKTNINEEFFENFAINGSKIELPKGIFLIKKTGGAKLENYLYKIAPHLFIK